MIRLEDLTPQTQLFGILPNQAVTIVDVCWHGNSAIELFFKRIDGTTGTQLLFRDDEEKLSFETRSIRQEYAANGELFRLAAEAYRIHLAHLFDPRLAVHTSLVEPLPHQITAVYGTMLSRHPLRYLLADDPGSGKTIMAGLLIKELMIRGDVRRCLICAPGGLTAQWQDELWYKFQLHFDILTREMVETSTTGNPFPNKDRLIIRLDQVARSDELMDKLANTDWDLIIVDEAHKMSASVWGGEIKYTRRYRLGEQLGRLTRHLLLMTATPHNGKEEDFQLFLRLLDPDRFAGRYREGVHNVDISDLMRRMQKETLLRFDGRPLFPERRAYTVRYELSSAEMELYEAVTKYVNSEFDRAERLLDERRRGTVGFALTVLQRRLASSPEAIYRSIERRRERLINRLNEARDNHNQAKLRENEAAYITDSLYDDEFWEEFDDSLAEEAEVIEETVLDRATAALTIHELEEEIQSLRILEQMAYRIRQSGNDRKWEQVAALLQDDQYMVDSEGRRRKLIIFTEHRDTLRYLRERITILFGRAENIVHIDGSLNRRARREVEDQFRNDPNIHFMLATDAAGEGINLQRAHLMINYDLPWNPNRLEQRFGRIHRIGQNEVCHLWNLVANGTREGYVYERLLRKLETEHKALQGRVFDVLGELFTEEPLRKLLMQAVRYGDRPDVRARLDQAIDGAVDQAHVRKLLEAQSLAKQALDLSQVEEIRAEMERYAARRLQPHFIKSFFVEAFKRLGGTVHAREYGRFRISHVPSIIRNHGRDLNANLPISRQYERICFDKSQINVVGAPQAEFICSGHILLETIIDLTLQQHRSLLQHGTMLIDPTDPDEHPRLLFFLEQTIRDAAEHPISQEVHFLEINDKGEIREAGSAPYLDYRSPTVHERKAIEHLLESEWLKNGMASTEIMAYAINQQVPNHLARVRQEHEVLVDKTLAAVKERLTKEINYWDSRAVQLRKQEKEGRKNSRLNAAKAQERADQLSSRLENRIDSLQLERQISATPPLIVGKALIIPLGYLAKLPGFSEANNLADMQDRRVTEAIAMHAVMETELALGYSPQDVSKENRGYDIESLDLKTGRLRLIEVKGRRLGAETVTLTRNEILTGINAGDSYILAIVQIDGKTPTPPQYVKGPFTNELDADAVSVNFDLQNLLNKSYRPL